ncbi:hypothetical protein [Nannocystis sp.]|uniref:hypothetical protein n=1 Tax=Nannocystis sp. TaxID=1962667 RepID=UPI0025F9CE6C|nr:hypothetical protein [Nannocystis sp.]MBK7829246.1 hypothetical protein [Nannocystis sp.]
MVDWWALVCESPTMVRWDSSIQPVAAKLRSETGFEKSALLLVPRTEISSFLVAGSGMPLSSLYATDQISLLLADCRPESSHHTL